MIGGAFVATTRPNGAAGALGRSGAECALSEQRYAMGLDRSRPGPGGTIARAAVRPNDGTATRELSAVGRVTLFYADRVRAELDGVSENAGHAELLLHWYARYGAEGFAHLSGMFAVAIWDGGRLTLARDPVGERTLFYARDGEGWMASNSLHPLKRATGASPRPNLAAVRAFLTFAYLPGEETLVEGVRQVPPGTVIHLEPDGGHAVDAYWEPQEEEEEQDGETHPVEHYAERLRRLVVAATEARLPKGDEVGVFLSGGLDSSLVAAIAARAHDHRVRTYAISFGEELPNELAYSSLVATHCSTRHRVLSFGGRAIAAHLPEAIALLDCPVGDPLTVPNLLLSRAAEADGLRVVLNGEGGDPLFGGPKNVPMLVHEMHGRDGDSGARARAYLFAYRKCYEDLPRLLSPEVRRALADEAPLESLVEPLLEHPRMRSYVNRLMYANLRMKGAMHILPKVERLTSASGIEGRAPLFDRRVAEYAFAIPPAMKLAPAGEKWALKEAVRDLLPATIVDRPKSGMRVPVQQWLHGPLQAMARDLLLGRRARARGLFRAEPIREWLAGEGAIWPRHGAKIWLLMTLELWLRAFLDE